MVQNCASIGVPVIQCNGIDFVHELTDVKYAATMAKLDISKHNFSLMNISPGSLANDQNKNTASLLANILFQDIKILCPEFGTNSQILYLGKCQINCSVFSESFMVGGQVQMDLESIRIQIVDNAGKNYLKSSNRLTVSLEEK